MKKLSILSFAAFIMLLANISAYCIDFKAEFSKRKMIVVLYDEDSENANAKAYNDILKTSFGEYWSDLQSEYKSQKEVDEMSHESLIDYSVLTMSTAEFEGVDFFLYNLNFAYVETNKKGKTSNELASRSFKVNIMNEFPQKSDLRYLITNMKIYFGVDSQFDRTQLEEVLAEKTLYIDKGFLSIEESEIKEIYPFPFKVVSTEEIFELAEKNDPNSIYFRLSIEKRMQGQKSVEMVDFLFVDCETGKTMARCNLSGLTKVSLNAPSEAHNNRKAEQKANSDYLAGFRSNPIYTGPRGGSFVGEELARIYTAKAKLKPTQFKYMCSEKKQSGFNPLMLY